MEVDNLWAESKMAFISKAWICFRWPNQHEMLLDYCELILSVCVCACVRACVRARARARVCVCVCLCVFNMLKNNWMTTNLTYLPGYIYIYLYFLFCTSSVWYLNISPENADLF